MFLKIFKKKEETFHIYFFLLVLEGALLDSENRMIATL